MEEAQEIAKRAISDRNSEIAGLKLTIAALEEKLNETTFVR